MNLLNEWPQELIDLINDLVVAGDFGSGEIEKHGKYDSEKVKLVNIGQQTGSKPDETANYERFFGRVRERSFYSHRNFRLFISVTQHKYDSSEISLPLAVSHNCVFCSLRSTPSLVRMVKTSYKYLMMAHQNASLFQPADNQHLLPACFLTSRGKREENLNVSFAKFCFVAFYTPESFF